MWFKLQFLYPAVSLGVLRWPGFGQEYGLSRNCSVDENGETASRDLASNMLIKP
jgi:hypothetical protein